MPPKRKNKSTKTSTTVSLKTLPANTASSPKRRNSAGFPGQKMSRLHPSEPLHMKTRRAVKTASNQDSSGAPSIASSSSRRSSLNDLSRSEDGHSEIEDERPTKRNRLSTDSVTDSFADQVDGALNAINANAPDSSMSTARDATDGSKVSPKKRRASDASFESGKSRANGVLTRTQSDTSEQQPRRKKRRTTTQTPAETDQLPELTDASTAPNSPEQIPEVENSQNLHHVLPTNGDAPVKMGRRLPGRRRAPHPDINVEVDLRRQLNLKMSYRSLAKIQKNILDELSNRTTTSLDDDPQFHKQCPEYEPLMASLDQYKQSRLDSVHALRREKLAQLERVVEAERHIAKEKYIQRFYDLQEDLLLQCFHRAKQLQRESRKSQDGAGTEDEDNVLPPARFAFPPLHRDDRVGSKFASRSRAYVESEHLLDEELRRAQFGGSLRDFILEDEDADDSILEAPTPVGFATFTGPDRAEAIAHQKIKDLIDAANDIENTPVAPPAPAVIPNEQADALFMLASLSADASRSTIEEKAQQPDREAPVATVSQQAASIGAAQAMLPVKQPAGPFAAVLNPVSKKADVVAQRKPAGVTDAIQYAIQPVKDQIAPAKQPPARSTHRIMDMLNNDSDIPPATSRFPPAASVEQTPADVTLHRISASQGPTPSRSGLFGLSSIMHQHDVQQERSTPTAPRETMPSREAYSSPASMRGYPDLPSKRSGSIRQMSLEELRRRDPLHMLRDMLSSKSKPNEKHVASHRPESSIFAPRERAQMTAPPLLSRPFSPSGTAEKADQSKETRRASSAYNASPSTAPLSYQQSPSAAPAYLPRQSSQDPGSSHWERDRRLSGSQAQQPPTQPFSASPQSKPVPPHQSPFSAPSAPAPAPTQLPSISQTLPSKSSDRQSNPPMNFRFAHYDPVPPRPYQNHNPQSGYPQASQAPPPAPPPQTQYTPSYNGHNGPSHQGGYVPPPGSFQAPPPPTTSTNASTPYPPLKIHQYGGQPILPANMAPPPPHTQPPSMTFIGQAAQQSAYSPPQHHAAPHQQQQLNTPYDANAPRDQPAERAAEPGSGPVRQPRRPYRSYHAPGSQFRPYTGPDSSRRRGG
ncbi:hypothetical protein DPSP01_009686 [Paraphaeosphaeria sporulosa]|uniref:Uncharacterized protein n=1 Tax=Paraphaeosphaeria sporulosa TaxID=1460663 RepID=A0A177CV15_9PLEO|nr:uncharacterized protein CC84DRAFT_1214310 [Paraphaeosphaeria sporulosa]OAG11051.1 hypothetical protein CC84DRAFT_1214310 [Paraphaeosphaeria sporulosa]